MKSSRTAVLILAGAVALPLWAAPSAHASLSKNHWGWGETECLGDIECDNSALSESTADGGRQLAAVASADAGLGSARAYGFLGDSVRVPRSLDNCASPPCERYLEVSIDVTSSHAFEASPLSNTYGQTYVAVCFTEYPFGDCEAENASVLGIRVVDSDPFSDAPSSVENCSATVWLAIDDGFTKHKARAFVYAVSVAYVGDEETGIASVEPMRTSIDLTVTDLEVVGSDDGPAGDSPPSHLTCNA